MLLGQLGVAQTEGKGNQRHGQTDPRDTEKALGFHVGGDHAAAGRGADGVGVGEDEGLGIRLAGQVCAAESLFEFRWQDLVPDGAGDGAADGVAEVVES